jgi:hypothetical protein
MSLFEPVIFTVSRGLDLDNMTLAQQDALTVFRTLCKVICLFLLVSINLDITAILF